MKDFKLKVPATVANLGPAFDVMGFAVKTFLTVLVEKKKGALIDQNPEDALSSAFISVAREEKRKIPENISFRQIENNIPRQSGLGSSSAARVAGVMIADRLLGLDLDPSNVFEKAAQLEGHPDNVAPALAGGITICYSVAGRLKYSMIEVPAELKVVIGKPELKIDTVGARRIMPKKVSIQDSVYSLARASLLVKALMEKDFSLLGEAMKDRLHQPYRKKKIPGFDEVVKGASRAGAYGTAISGSGPCVFSFTGKSVAKSVGEEMVKVWKEKGIAASYIVTEISQKGAQIIE